MKNKLIIWDWNGTLLNDVEVCVDAMNIMLSDRNMKHLDQNTYKDIFTFPVQNYYKTLGFDFNEMSFEKLSVEYIDLYTSLSNDAPLQDGSIEALEFFKNKGYKQIILSASEQKNLELQVHQRNIAHYFDAIIGLDNIHARSKLHNALIYIQKSDIEVDMALFIGDTYHDYEVANAIGCKCVLVQNGHQNLNLFEFNSRVIKIQNLNDILSLKPNISVY